MDFEKPRKSILTLSCGTGTQWEAYDRELSPEPSRNTAISSSFSILYTNIPVFRSVATQTPSQRATFQLVGRGPGGHAGVRTAFQGTLVPGDRDTEHRTLLLLGTLERLTQSASSRVLTGSDPLTAVVLKPMRDLATRQTIRHLAELDRDPWDLSGSPLSMVKGATVYPLVPVQGQPHDQYTHRKALALDVAGTLPAGC
jgi:hypothetical protein